MLLDREAQSETPHVGLRMTAEENSNLGETNERNELIDGMVCISPSPAPRHQQISFEIFTQIKLFLLVNPIGRVFYELVIFFGRSKNGGNLVYRPDIVFYTNQQLPTVANRVTAVPGVIADVLSHVTRQMDLQTKKVDFQNAGVKEYRLTDPENQDPTIPRLVAGRFVNVAVAGDRFTSAAIAGFILDLSLVRAAFGS